MKKAIENPAAVLPLIKSGSENGVSLAEICRRTGLSPRGVRKSVEALRRSGTVIASGEKGYYYPAEQSELRQYIQRMERTAKSIFFTLKAARAALKDYES